MLKKLSLWMIRFYKNNISYLFTRSCRFVPSCSEYSYRAIEKYGFIKGLGKSIWRILRCNPLSRGGYDPA